MTRSGPALLLLLAACSGTPKRPPSPIEQARLLVASGDEARAIGDPAGAARSYARALASARAGDDRRLAADVGYRLGIAYLSAGLAREAAAELDDAARTAAAVGDGRLEARALLALARARQDLGGEAVADALGRALAAARAAGDRPGEALAHVGLAALADDAGARGHLAEAEALAGGEASVAAPLALNRARRAERAGDAAAGGLYRAAADGYRALEDGAGLYEALAGAARAADRDAGGAAQAAELHRRAADAALRTGASRAAAAELRRAAAAHARAGDADQAARREAEAGRLEQGQR